MRRILRLLPQYLVLIAVAAGCGDKLPGNLNTGAGKLDLSIVMAVDKDSAVTGDLVTFTMTVTNLGPIAADTVTGGDTLPSGLTYVSSAASDGAAYSPTTGIWAIGTLPVNGVRTLSLTATVNAGTAGIVLTNRAGVLAFQVDSVLQNNLASSSFRSVALPASQLAFTTEPASTSAGASFGVVVTARDGQGNTVTGYTGSVSVAISSGTGTAGASLSGRTTEAAVAGVATFSGLSIDSAGTGYRLTGSATGLTSSTSATFNIVAGQLAFTTQPANATAGGASFGVVLAARDVRGNTMTGYTGSVSVAISSGTGTAGASLSGTTTVAAVAGVATFSGLSIDSVGTGYRLTASATGLTSATSTTFSVSAAVASDEPADPGSGYLWSDNFDRYPSVAHIAATGSCPPGSAGFGLPSGYTTYGQLTSFSAGADPCNPPSLYSLVTGRGGTGKALRANVPSGGPLSITWLSPWNLNTWGDYSGTIVAQFYFRVSVGGTPNYFGTKWLELWSVGNSQRGQWSLYTGTDARPLWGYSYSANRIGGYTRQPVGPWWDEVNDGNWHRFTVLFKANTASTYAFVSGTTAQSTVYAGTSSRDGRVAAWIDRTKILDYSQTTVGVTPPGGLNPWCYQAEVDAIPAVKTIYLKFPDVFNANNLVAFTLDHDDLKVWRF